MFQMSTRNMVWDLEIQLINIAFSFVVKMIIVFFYNKIILSLEKKQI